MGARKKKEVLTAKEWIERFYPVPASTFYPPFRVTIPQWRAQARVEEATLHSLLKWEGVLHAAENGYLAENYSVHGYSVASGESCALCQVFVRAAGSCAECPLASDSYGDCFSSKSPYSKVLSARGRARVPAIRRMVQALYSALEAVQSRATE